MWLSTARAKILVLLPQADLFCKWSGRVIKLNAAQSEAVTYTSGPCLVLAGAGSGKTRVIITKIAYLLRNSLAQASEILAVTFTNKAAAEMRERISLEVDEQTAKALTISTFHSLGRIILKEQAALLKLGRNFSIFDDADSFKVIKQIISNDFPNLKDGNSNEYISQICHKISMWKGELKTPKAVAKDPHADVITTEIYRKYAEYLRACNAVDFDDLIFIPTRLLLLREDVREYYQKRFRYILVDEYQDTNHTQYYLLMCLVAGTQRFTVVGDDDQSIYSWRGARPENIKKLTEDFPELKVIKLEQNYRSTSRILRCANSIIANNPHLFEKTLFSGLSEGEKIKVVTCDDNDHACDYVAAEILGQHFDKKNSWAHYAILYRSNSQARDMEKALLSAHIPCKITGDTGFFARMEVKDIMAWCRVLANPRDDAALLRVINIPQRGIGAQTIKAMTDLSHKFNRCLYDCACSVELQQMLNKTQQDAMAGFLGLLVGLRRKLNERDDLYVCQNLIETIGYVRYLKADNSPNALEWKMKNVQTLMSWVEELVEGKKGDKLSFADAVERLGLREMMDKRTDEDGDNAVQMMTLHASKGLEFPYVFLIGMEEGLLPHRTSIDENNIEEERRLAYVGVTRAQKELTLVRCRQRKHGGGMIQPEPSRFIFEMPEQDICYINQSEGAEQDSSTNLKDIGRAIAMLKDSLTDEQAKRLESERAQAAKEALMDEDRSQAEKDGLTPKAY